MRPKCDHPYSIILINITELLYPESNASANSATSAYVINLAFLIVSSQFHCWYFLLTEYTKARISATTL